MRGHLVHEKTQERRRKEAAARYPHDEIDALRRREINQSPITRARRALQDKVEAMDDGEYQAYLDDSTTEMAKGVTEQWGVHMWTHLDRECTGRAGASDEMLAASREQWLWMGQDEHAPLPGLQRTCAELGPVGQRRASACRDTAARWHVRAQRRSNADVSGCCRC